MTENCPVCVAQRRVRYEPKGLDLVGEYRGGNPDARHQIYDAVAEGLLAGENPRRLAEAYNLPLEHVIAINAEVRS